MSHRTILSPVLFFLTAVNAAAQTLPSRATIVLIDTSSSMGGPRITSAKAESLSVLRQVPPSKDHPVILIPFAGTPHHVATYYDLPSLEAALKQIDADGSTNISAALNAGADSLKRYAGVRHFCLMLFTDDEDTDSQPGELDAAVKKLDALLGTRHQKSLSNLLVLKRWENSSASLVTRLAQGKHSTIVDVKDLKLTPATLTPAVTIRKVTWVRDTPLTLDVEADASVALTGIPFDPRLPTGELRCTDAGAVLTPLTLRPGDKATPFRMRLPVPRATALTGNTTAHFTVQPKSGGTLPQLSSHTLAVPITLPPLSTHCTLSATFAVTGVTWSDALAGKPLVKGTLTCTVTADVDVPWTTPLTLRLEPEGCRLLSGQADIEMQKADSVSMPLTLEADPVATNATHFPVTLTVRSVQASAGVTVDPPQVRLTRVSPVPPIVDTAVTTTVQKITEASWIDLAQGIAAFDADVQFTVTGPLPPGTQIVLLCPAGVQPISVEPRILHPGKQTVRLALHAKLPAAPTVAQLDMQIQPPPSTGAVRFLPPPPIRLRVPGPEPLPLLLVNPDGSPASVTIRDRSAPVGLTGVPVVAGIADPQIAAGVTVRIQTGGQLIGIQDPGPIPVNTPVVLPITVPATEMSFFFDTVIEEEIEVTPDPASTALVSCRQRITVTIEAPFKAILCYAAWALLGLIVLGILALIYFRTTQEGHADAPSPD